MTIHDALCEVAPAAGRPRQSSGRGFRKREPKPQQLLISAEEAGALAGISGQQWRHNSKAITGFPQPVHFPPGSKRLAWKRAECESYLTNLPPVEW